MAKFKVHLMVDSEVGDLHGGALCKTKHRTLLPLKLASTWDAVTCERCLRHRPALSTRERLASWWRRVWRSR